MYICIQTYTHLGIHIYLYDDVYIYEIYTSDIYIYVYIFRHVQHVSDITFWVDLPGCTSYLGRKACNFANVVSV